MIVDIDIRSIKANIRQAESLVKPSIGLMFKSFYEDIYYHIGDLSNNIYSKNIQGSVCYGLCQATEKHSACVINDFVQYEDAKRLGIDKFYIPINARDNREGLSVNDAYQLCSMIRQRDVTSDLYGMITSGCLNENHPSEKELNIVWDTLGRFIKSLSLGGSYWIAKKCIPSFVGEIRIGEFMLFGTIPYSSDERLQGRSAISIRSSVISVFRDRGELIIDCGYSLADVDKCQILTQGLRYVDSSSEYSIFRYDRDFRCGDEIIMTPNYKSLVKLKDAERNYL